MMSHQARRITNEIQRYDYKLYAKKDNDGVIRIYRESKELRPEKLTGEIQVLNVVRNDHLVMSLTDTWGTRGKSVDWGVLPIMARLRAMDLWNSNNLATEVFKNEELDEKARGKALRNTVEDFLYDFKGQFARSTNDINTSSLSKRAFNKRIEG
jgi:hypothetical protein